jgi:hypothetical protein
VNLEVMGGKTTRVGPAIALLFLCAATVPQQSRAQSPNDGDVSGTTWDCRIDLNKADTSGHLAGAPHEDHVLFTFIPGGSSVSAKLPSDHPQPPADDGQGDWSFGEWKQEGAMVRTVSNGTVESFHAQPWNNGDAERMMELKISGDRMQGLLLSHSTNDSADIQCQLQSSLPDANAHMTDAGNASSLAGPGSPVVDVRVSSAYTRILTSGEMAALRDSLHWEPESAVLRVGGTAESNLVDNAGRKLGSIRAQWTRTVAPKGTRSEPAGPVVGSFTFEMENGTSCGFLGQAELDGPKGSVILGSVELDSWVGLHQPGPGETIRVEGDAVLPSPNPSVVLRPLVVSSALSACVTPRNP